MPISKPEQIPDGSLAKRLHELERQNRLLTEGLKQADRLRALWNKSVEDLKATKRRLQASEERFSLAMEGARDGLWDRDLVAGTHYFSPQACRILNLPDSDCVQGWEWWMERVHPEDMEKFRHALNSTEQASDGRFEVTVRLRASDNSYRWVLCRGITLRDSTGAPRRFIGTMADMTEWVMAEQQLRLGAQVIKATHEGVVVTNANAEILSVNPAFTTMTGYREEDVLGRNPAMLQSGRQDREFYRNMWSALSQQGHWHGEIWNRRQDGSIYAEELSISAIRDPSGQISHYVGIFSDITERMKREEVMRRLAFHDTLTGLPNRSLFVDRVHQALRQAHRADQMVAILFMDLDRFKQVNDTYGHQTGDLLLLGVARRIRELLREEDTIARLGGDEFTAVLRSVQSKKDVALVAGRILQQLAKPFDLEGRVAEIGVSIGAALFPEHSRDADTLIRFADEAMYQAKSEGRGRFVIYGGE
ncbi:MAG: diguanylate cyclase [Gammaproteobacteria bacterium]|nr:diguanylate cyclase [Gammaproteobacteria bacterium]MCP5137333.1 diguanylate cyclase [Gammaproteobacteria bacterium]